MKGPWTDKAVEALNEWASLAHAMQTGVAMEMNHNNDPTSPKHLRVGVNTALTDHSSLAELLMQKGVITAEEYAVAIRDGMQREVERYEAHLSELLGAPVKLR